MHVPTSLKIWKNSPNFLRTTTVNAMQPSPPPSVHWSGNRLLEGLTSPQFSEIQQHLKTQLFEDGELIFSEGDSGKRIYLIESGQIEVYKENPRVVLALLNPGMSFGGMALFNNVPRAATCKAVGPTKLAYLTRKKMKMLSEGQYRSIYYRIIQNHVKIQQETVHKADSIIMEQTRLRLKEAREKIVFASFFTTLVLIISLYVFALRTSLTWIENLQDSTPVTTGLLILFSLFLVVMMRRNKMRPEMYGLHLDNWKQVLGEALLWTLGFVAVVTLLKFVAIQWVPAFEGRSLFEFPDLEVHKTSYVWLIAGMYSLFAPIQEFIARGVIQGTLQNFLTGKYVTTRAILIATLLFSITHLHLDMSLAVFVIVPSIFWGIMYARHRSLLGVSISHIIIGLYVLFVMGFQVGGEM